MIIDQCVSEVRAFNRFYTVFLGILNNTYLKSKFSLAEVRVMHAALLQPGITSTEIVSVLKVDKSYLSRMIRRLVRLKILSRKKSSEDGRSFHLYITPHGRKEFENLDTTATKEMKEILKNLSEKDCTSLMRCMSRIEKILSKV
jgi:DNA-binding MarR family transcriptional regulator